MGSFFSFLCPFTPIIDDDDPAVSPAKLTSESGLSDSDFDNWKLVGEGGFGGVFSATLKQTGQIWAIKKIPREEIDRYVRGECINLAKCNHSQIITYKDAYLTSQHLCVVMEFATGGDLHSYIQEKKNLPEKHARWLFQQVICAMDYCHRFGIAHRDIKLENTLLVLEGSRPLIKICDFGVARSGNLQEMRTKDVGTVGYIAPEVLIGGQDEPYDGAKADIWSAGVMLYAMVIGQHPFVTSADVERNDFMAANQRTMSADYRFPRGAILTPGLTDLLSKILVPHPPNRINLNEIFEHPWFAKELPEGAKSRLYKLSRHSAEREAHLLALFKANEISN